MLGAVAPEEGTLSLLGFPLWLCPAHRRVVSDSPESGAGTRWRTRTRLGTSPSSAERPSSCSSGSRRLYPPVISGGVALVHPSPAAMSWPLLTARPGASQGRSEVQRPSCKGAAEQQLCSAPVPWPALARIVSDSSLGSVHAADFPVAQWGLGGGRQTCCSGVNPLGGQVVAWVFPKGYTSIPLEMKRGFPAGKSKWRVLPSEAGGSTQAAETTLVP